MTLPLLVKKEFLGHLLSLRFTIVSCGLLAVMVAFTISQSLAYLEQVEEYGSGGPGPPEGSSEQQVVVVDQAPSLLGSLLGGSSTDRVQRLALVDGVPHVSLRRVRDPMEVLFPSGNLGFVLGTVVSLLAIIMSYDSLCGERETGTLRLLLSYGVGRDKVLLSKWAGGMLALSAPFAVGVCICALVAGGLVDADIGLRGTGVTLSVVAVSVIYMGVVLSLGVLVSVLADRPASAMAVLLSIWALQVGLLPGLVPQLVAASGAWSSPESIEREKRKILNQLRADESALRADPQFRAAEEVKPGLFLLGLNDAGKQRQEELRPRSSREILRLYNDYSRRTMSQVSLAQGLLRVSFHGSMLFAIAALAGGDELAAIQGIQARGGAGDSTSEQWKSVRDRSPMQVGSGELSLGAAAVKASPDCLLLVLWLVVFSGASHLAFAFREI